ncbi:SRPBCC domain-containing protein [Sphingobacterium gobiense]|uniref:ATPase n=1 Tax=Sphingobacterium gobiense TaxID=1382456 RepID=A0A2S9JRJ0_9SPHI|nr:SRPBCC domain-containing protein [Sphingobacterium gobiense]PRD55902.1 ATPase [Sphingobacterium gobiense]
MKLTATAKIQIQKPIAEVFDAIIKPEKMNGYFIADATGKLEKGVTVEWLFPEFPERFPVTGKEITSSSYISFDWSGGLENQLVEIFLTESDNQSTVVKVIEHEMDNTIEGIERVKGQTEGWANFLACLKAYLEYGINLRQGAFDFMRSTM